MEFGLDITKLQNILQERNDEDSDEDFDRPMTQSAQMGPGNIGPSSNKKESKSEVKQSIYEKKQTKDIWDVDEVEEGAEFDTLDDPRMQPEYEILYKQQLASEDIFLNMSNKTPATSSCENMIVKIKLPGISYINEIDINVYDKFLDCRTSRYRLGLHLPHPVNSKSATAKWNSNESILIVTMKMNREFDFINL